MLSVTQVGDPGAVGSLAQAPELMLVGNRVYIYDRKNQPLVARVMADLDELGVPYEFRDVEAYPAYAEQAERLWSEYAARGGRPDVGHTWPLVVFGAGQEVMSGYSRAEIEGALQRLGIRVGPRIPLWAWIAGGVAVVGGIGYLIFRRRRR